MTIPEAQREIRTVFLGGFPGALVAGTLWLVSAVLGTWRSPTAGVLALIIGGMAIFPGALLVLKMMGRSSALSPENSLNQLATQVAFTIPASYPLIAAAATHNLNWFYPAMMVVVGAHYLPFMFLYGMWQYLVLAALLIVLGVHVGIARPHDFAAGAWVTAGVLLLSALPLRAMAARKDRDARAGGGE